MRTILVLIGLASSSVALAENCDNVIALSKVVSTVVSDKESVEQHASNFCSEYKRSQGSSSSVNFGASYKFLSASYASGRASMEEVASKYCSAANDSAASKDAYRQYIENISPNAYGAYEQCLRMSQELIFAVNIVLPEEFVLSTGFRPRNPNPQTDVLYSTSAGVNCAWDATATSKRTIKMGTTAVLKCQRKDRAKRSFVTIVRTTGVDEQLTIPWQAYDKDGVPFDTIRSLSQRISSVDDRLAGVSADLGRVAYESGTITMRAVGTRPLIDQSQCPEGPDAHRGDLNGRVEFSKAFNSIPVVTIGVAELNLLGDATRISVGVSNVDSKGFNYSFATWCQTAIHGARASWIAVAK